VLCSYILQTLSGVYLQAKSAIIQNGMKIFTPSALLSQEENIRQPEYLNRNLVNEVFLILCNPLSLMAIFCRHDYTFCYATQALHYSETVKGKAVPVTGHGVP
jgi:hypothetical protein